MTTKEIFEKDKTVFDGFGHGEWSRYYSAINKEVPVEKVKDAPYFLELTENEKQCYLNSLNDLKNERKSFPQASYEVQTKDFD